MCAQAYNYNKQVCVTAGKACSMLTMLVWLDACGSQVCELFADSSSAVMGMHAPGA